MLQAVIFDFGGTLFRRDDAYEKAARAQWRALKEMGYDITWENYQELSRKTSEIFDERYYGSPERFEYGNYSEVFFEVWGKEGSEDDFRKADRRFREKLVESQRPMTGANEILKFCKSMDLVLGAITNGNKMMTEKRLQKLEDPDAFDEVVYTTDIGADKSRLEPFEVFLEETGLQGRKCLMVGDRPDEDTYAKKLGMETVLLTKDPLGSVGDEVEPDYRIGELVELKAIIEELS